MQTKLLCNSETDVTPDRHEQWAPGMGYAQSIPSQIEAQNKTMGGSHTQIPQPRDIAIRNLTNFLQQRLMIPRHTYP